MLYNYFTLIIMTEYSLYRKFPGLKELPRVDLVESPTPVERLPKSEEKLGMQQIWIKRDDLTNSLYGGNKPRKYEFMMADALEKGKKDILTIGGIGSNHALANTIYCKELGLNSHIFLIDQPLLPMVRKNMLCDYYFGGHMHYCKSELGVACKIIKHFIFNWKSYLIMPGASVPLGTIGFVNAAFELAKQVKHGEIPEPDHLFVAVGSGGTCAGLTLGLELAGLNTKVHGVRVAMHFVTSERAVLRLAKKTLKLMRKTDPSIPKISKSKLSERLRIYHRFYGGEYGRITEEGLEAVEFIKDDEIELETTYTGKAFSGLLSHCRECQGNEKEKIILFWNTYNSRNLSEICKKVDYHDLPEVFHKFFDGTISLDKKAVVATEQNNK